MHFPDDRLFAFARLWERWECDGLGLGLGHDHHHLCERRAREHPRPDACHTPRGSFFLLLDPAYEGNEKLSACCSLFQRANWLQPRSKVTHEQIAVADEGRQSV